MQKSLIYTYITLLLLTFLVASLALFGRMEYTLIGIIIFSVIKFLLVGFEFLELRKAHQFWKVLFVGYAFFMGMIFIMLL